MGQDEQRIVVRGDVPPPSFPLKVSPRAALGAEHVAAHDVCADAWPPAGCEGVVRSSASARFAVDPVKRLGRSEPLEKPATRVPEGRVASLSHTGREAVERHREAMDSNA